MAVFGGKLKKFGTAIGKKIKSAQKLGKKISKGVDSTLNKASGAAKFVGDVSDKVKGAAGSAQKLLKKVGDKYDEFSNSEVGQMVRTGVSAGVPGGAQLIGGLDAARGAVETGETLARKTKNTAKKVKKGSERAEEQIEKVREKKRELEEGGGGGEAEIWEAPFAGEEELE